MSYINWSIDYIQDTKKQFVISTVENTAIRDGLLEFVEKQRELTKIIAKNFELMSRETMTLSFPNTNICKK